MKKNVFLFLLLATAVVGSLWAQETEEPRTPETEEEIVFGETEPDGAVDEPESIGTLSVWSFVSMVLILAAVVALIYGLFFLLKRLSGRNYPDNDLIRIVSSKTLSSTRGVHLISLGNRYILLGSAENSVNLIQEIDDKESRDEIEVFLAREVGPSKKSFKTLISGILSGSDEKGDQSVSSSAEFLKSQGQRMKDL